MFRAVIPVLSDDVAHNFADAEHINTVHAKYGNNHVEKALADSAGDNDTSKNQNTVKTEDQLPAHISTGEYLYDFALNLATQNFPYKHLCNLSAAFISKQAPPPRFS